MISTCHHCKKQFEWEMQEPVIGCTFAVQCCHCRSSNGINAKGKVRPLIQSKPLQVAKKWVVTKGKMVLDKDGLFSSIESQGCHFNFRQLAAKALANWIEKFPESINQPLMISEVSE